MTANALIGTWRLLSFEIKNEHGQVYYPLGNDAVGYLIYTADGHMFLAMMKSNRPLFASEDPSQGSLEEKATASNSYMTYCGTYHYQENRIIHHLELSHFPNWAGHDLERIVELEGNKLSLKTVPQLVFGGQQTGYLIWTRV